MAISIDSIAVMVKLKSFAIWDFGIALWYSGKHTEAQIYFL